MKVGDELASIRRDLNVVEEEIKRGLMHTIHHASIAVDRGIYAMARLDVIFAKAAFGVVLNGIIPKVKHDGQISVKNFVHPVLALRKGLPIDTIPIDLFLSHDQESHALIISGANGGGKTVALKSFGLVAEICKLAIPVPQSSTPTSSAVPPRVDFFDNVLVDVGDQQSVLEGESTLMAKLNVFSSVIKSVVGGHKSSLSSEDKTAPCSNFSLVLMDELGGGTDPAAGGALAQAVVEKLLECENCRIVATTHSPRLKALSYNSTQYRCATVLLTKDPSSDFKRPSYKLEYGSIGDSYALGAASRCSPPLPDAVLTRAASLIAAASSEREAENVDYLRALTASLEREKEAAMRAKSTWENSARELQACRFAMMRLTEMYSDHWDRVENRMQEMFRALRDDESKDAIDIVGETLETLKIVRKKVKTEEELLKERGLKKVSPDYKFQEGESVVIIAAGEWEGTTATIMANGMLDNDVLAVVPSPSMWNDPFFSLDGQSIDTTTSEPKPLIVKRSEVAVWDMNSVWDDFDDSDSPVTSIRESRQRLAGLLSTLKASQKEAQPARLNSIGNSFKSTRQRKAARTKRKRK